MAFVRNLPTIKGLFLGLAVWLAAGLGWVENSSGQGMVVGAQGLSETGAISATPQPDAPKPQNRPSARLELDSARVVMVSHFSGGAKTQVVDFDRPVTGRYFCLESLSSNDGRPFAAVAELDLLDASGQPLNRQGWRIAYADSEERDRENGSAENAIDGDPATYWHTQWGNASPNHPHHLVIDLGKSKTIAGFRYEPRPGEGNVGGRIKDYRIYVGDDLVAENEQDKSPPAECYLFSYFIGNSEDGLHLAYSLNGYRWDVVAHGNSLLKPEVGGKLMRDPCLYHSPDGTFHLVWTAGWTGNFIGHAASKDLVHWSAQEAIPVMADVPNAFNCWAPEIIWDASQKQFVIFWASTLTNQTVAPRAPAIANKNRIYCMTTRDFKTFSPTRLMYDPGFSMVDATLFPDGNRFYLIFKDESSGRMRMAAGDHPDGPFGAPGTPFTQDYGEGPTAFRLGNQVAVFFHMSSQPHYGAVISPNLTDWKNISAGIFLPPDGLQGTVLQVPGKTLLPLMQTGLLEIGTTPEASELGVGNWIWATNLADRQMCRLWRSIEIPPDTRVVRSQLRITADNSYTAYLDGVEIGRGGDPNSLTEYDLTWLMTPGTHVLAVEAFNDTFDAGVILGLRVDLADQKKLEVFSDNTWRVVTENERGWKTKKQPDDSWPLAQVVGYAGKAWWQYPYQVTRIPPSLPPFQHFWQQSWFLISLLVACLLVAVFSVRQGLQLAVQARSHRLLERERVRIARDIHDDLGAGLTQLTLLGELVLRENPHEDATRNRLNELCTKARALLRSMDEIVWAVNPRRDTVKDFAAFISEHAQEFLASTAIRCRQEMTEELPAILLDLPQRRNLMLATKEAIRNAASHSGADEVNLKIEVVENSLKVVIEDNGRGFSPAEAETGRNGMINMKQRLADIGGSFTLTTAPGQGCRITLLVPLFAREKMMNPNP